MGVNIRKRITLYLVYPEKRWRKQICLQILGGVLVIIPPLD